MAVAVLVRNLRIDAKQHSSVMSYSFKGGKALALDATYADSFSASNLYTTILNPGSASSAVKDLNRRRYPQLVADFQFVPMAIEMSWIIGSVGCSLLTDIGCHILRPTNVPRQTSYIFQHISVAIIRSNALATTSSFRRYTLIYSQKNVRLPVLLFRNICNPCF